MLERTQEVVHEELTKIYDHRNRVGINPVPWYHPGERLQKTVSNFKRRGIRE
jgi:hypothetical protein